MTSFSLVERAAFYAKTFPKFPPLRADSRWLDGMWVLGQNYQGSGYYGSYPPNYLHRVESLFPDKERVLHLFSGSLPQGEYICFDRQGDPDIKGEAEKLTEYLPPNMFDLVLADPPYSEEDAQKYGTCLISRNKVLEQVAEVLSPGGYVVWLDQVLPMFSKKWLHLCGLIGIVRSTNHRFRVASIFQKPIVRFKRI